MIKPMSVVSIALCMLASPALADPEGKNPDKAREMATIVSSIGGQAVSGRSGTGASDLLGGWGQVPLKDSALDLTEGSAVANSNGASKLRFKPD